MTGSVRGSDDVTGRPEQSPSTISFHRSFPITMCIKEPPPGSFCGTPGTHHLLESAGRRVPTIEAERRAERDTVPGDVTTPQLPWYPLSCSPGPPVDRPPQSTVLRQTSSVQRRRATIRERPDSCLPLLCLSPSFDPWVLTLCTTLVACLCYPVVIPFARESRDHGVISNKPVEVQNCDRSDNIDLAVIYAGIMEIRGKTSLALLVFTFIQTVSTLPIIPSRAEECAGKSYAPVAGSKSVMTHYACPHAQPQPPLSCS
ncbi:hypothetical protein J6590_023076 [Homalodisca vitripennis]|nr:hypothetical protein J6590_023076 [Homalodisca vitripennis]